MITGVKYVYDENMHRIIPVFDETYHQKMCTAGDAVTAYMKTFGEKENAYRHCVDWSGFWYFNGDSEPPNKKLICAALRFGLTKDEFICRFGYVDGDEFIYGNREKDEFCDASHIYMWGEIDEGELKKVETGR